MAKIKEAWDRASKFERVSLGISGIISIIVIILAILGLTHIIPIAITNAIIVPMLGIMTLINGINSYKKRKGVGIFSIICSIYLFYMFISGIVEIIK